MKPFYLLMILLIIPMAYGGWESVLFDDMDIAIASNYWVTQGYYLDCAANNALNWDTTTYYQSAATAEAGNIKGLTSNINTTSSWRVQVKIATHNNGMRFGILTNDTCTSLFTSLNVEFTGAEDAATMDIRTDQDNYASAVYTGIAAANDNTIFTLMYNHTTHNLTAWRGSTLSKHIILDLSTNTTFANGFSKVHIGGYGSAGRTNSFDWINVTYLLEDAGPPAESNSLAVILKNDTNQTISSLSEHETYRVFANYSYPNGTPVLGGSCNMTLLNSTSHFHYASAENYSLNNSGQWLNYSFTDNSSGTLDVIHIEMCKGLIADDAVLYINNTQVKYLKNEIPLCSSGQKHAEIYDTSAFVNNMSVKIGINCPSCSGSENSYIKLLPTSLNDIIELNRLHLTYTEEMNYGFPYYYYPGHSFITDRDFNVSVTCDSYTSSQKYDVFGINLSIDILSVNDENYASGMVIEAGELYYADIDVSGDIISFLNLSILYYNGSMVKQGSLEYINFTNAESFGSGIYNMSVIARDNENETSFLTDYFVINDTTNPTIAWTYPADDNSSAAYTNASGNLMIGFNDINLFAYECLVYNNAGTLQANFTQLGLTPPSASLNQNITFNSSGTWRVDCTASDSHTAELIPDSKYTADLGKIEYEFTKIIDRTAYKNNVSVSYEGLYQVEKAETTKLDDRYTFNYTFYLGDKKFLKDVIHTFRVACSNLYVPDHSIYPGHIVCWDAKQWIDFNSPDVLDYAFVSCGVGCMDVILKTAPNEEIVFNSIGGINQISESRSIEVSDYTAPASGVFELNLTTTCPSDTASVLLLFLIAAIVIGILLLCMLVVKVPIITMAFSIVAFSILGFALYGCSVTLGILLVILGLVIAVTEVFL